METSLKETGISSHHTRNKSFTLPRVFFLLRKKKYIYFSFILVRTMLHGCEELIFQREKPNFKYPKTLK